MEIEENKLNYIVNEILAVERENLRTKDKNRVEMADAILKMIKEEVSKCY